MDTIRQVVEEAGAEATSNASPTWLLGTRCNGHNCAAEVANASEFLCRKHWKMVPAEARREYIKIANRFYAAKRLGTVNAALRELYRSAERCVIALNAELGAPSPLKA